MQLRIFQLMKLNKTISPINLSYTEYPWTLVILQLSFFFFFRFSQRLYKWKDQDASLITWGIFVLIYRSNKATTMLQPVKPMEKKLLQNLGSSYASCVTIHWQKQIVQPRFGEKNVNQPICTLIYLRRPTKKS